MEEWQDIALDRCVNCSIFNLGEYSTQRAELRRSKLDTRTSKNSFGFMSDALETKSHVPGHRTIFYPIYLKRV